MDIKFFNTCLLLGWLMLTVGGCIVHPGWGLVLGGVVMLALTFASAWLGGLRASTPKPAKNSAEANLRAETR
jgi:hypothetical protein